LLPPPVQEEPLRDGREPRGISESVDPPGHEHREQPRIRGEHAAGGEVGDHRRPAMTSSSRDWFGKGPVPFSTMMGETLSSCANSGWAAQIPRAKARSGLYRSRAMMRVSDGPMQK